MSSPASWPPEPVTVPERHPLAPAPGTVLPEHDPGCFGCGGLAADGLRMRFTVGDGLSVHAEFIVRQVHQGSPGIAHGGVLTAALDEVLGTVNVLTMTPAVTGRLNTEFRRPVPVGSTVHFTSTLDGLRGRRIFVSATGRLDTPDGPEAVSATAVFVAVPPEHFETHGRFLEDTGPRPD